jgi:hypothetical protein
MVEDFAFNALTRTAYFEPISHNAEFGPIKANNFRPERQIDTAQAA